MIREILGDLKNGIEKDIISSKFHNTIGEVIFTICLEISESSSVGKVAVSGGCFQNKFL